MTATVATHSPLGVPSSAPAVVAARWGDLTPASVEGADARDLAHQVAEVTEAEVLAMTAAQAEALVLAAERAKAALDARQSLAMDVLAGRVDAQLQDRARDRAQARATAAQVAAARGEQVRVPAVLPGPDLYGFVGSMLAPGLRSTTGAVARRVQADQRMVTTTTTTFAALWDGDLDQGRADAVTEVAQHLHPDQWETFEALLYETTADPVTGEVTLISAAVKALTRGELTRRARRIARYLDPATEHRTAQAATDRRRVEIRPDRHQPGLAVWTAHLPSTTSQQMAAAVDALATRIAKAHPGMPMDAARADALAALVAGNADITTTIELLVPVLPARTSFGSAGDALDELNPVTATLAPTAGEGAGGEPGALPGGEPGAVAWFLPGVVEDPRHGVLLPEAVAALLANPDTIIRLARLDPDGSITQDPTAYRPSASTRRRVRARDGACRFPGCTTPAARTDTDHVIPHPHGPTHHTNLIALCRTHHLFKHHAGWTPTLAPDGTLTWTAPDGRTWTTHPRPHTLREELHLHDHLDHLDPDTRHHLARGWVPGLPPGLTLADLAITEHQLPDDPPQPTDQQVPDPPPDWQDLDHPVDQPLSPPVTPGSTLERALAIHIAHALAA